MKFQHQVITDLTDAQRNFEQITAHGIDDATALGGALKGTLPNPAFAASALAQLGIARGAGSVTFTNSNQSADATVTHGLAGTPTSVVATTLNNPYALAIDIRVGSVTSTTFTVACICQSSLAGTNNLAFSWIAVL